MLDFSEPNSSPVPWLRRTPWWQQPSFIKERLGGTFPEKWFAPGAPLKKTQIRFIEFGSKALRQCTASYDSSSHTYRIDPLAVKTDLLDFGKGMTPTHDRLNPDAMKDAVIILQANPDNFIYHPSKSKNIFRIAYATAAFRKAQQDKDGRQDIGYLAQEIGAPVIVFTRQEEAEIIALSAERFINLQLKGLTFQDANICCYGGGSIEHGKLKQESTYLTIDYKSLGAIDWGEWPLRTECNDRAKRATGIVVDHLRDTSWNPQSQKRLFLANGGYVSVLREIAAPITPISTRPEDTTSIPWNDEIASALRDYRNKFETSDFPTSKIRREKEISNTFTAAALLGMAEVAKPKELICLPPRSCSTANGILADLGLR